MTSDFEPIRSTPLTEHEEVDSDDARVTTSDGDNPVVTTTAHGRITHLTTPMAGPKRT